MFEREWYRVPNSKWKLVTNSDGKSARIEWETVANMEERWKKSCPERFRGNMELGTM